MFELKMLHFLYGIHIVIGNRKIGKRVFHSLCLLRYDFSVIDLTQLNSPQGKYLIVWWGISS